jgi:PqqD family protein of HPr-rel-A system
VTGDDAGIAGSAAPKPRPWVAAVELDGETVLYDESSGRLHLLDSVATVVWSRLDGAATVDDLTRDLSATFAADESRVRADLTEFLRRLDREQLLEGVAPAGPQA